MTNTTLSRLLSLSAGDRAAVLGRLAAPTDAPPPVATDDGRHPASFGQEQLWLLDQLAPGSSRYNVPFAFELTGPVDDEAVVASLADVAVRHPALRTSLERADGALWQQTEPQVAAEVGRVDVSAATDPWSAALTHARAVAAEPFELGHAPLWRAVLIRVAADRRLLVWIASHAVADGWSIGVLARDLSAAYAARTGAAAAPRPPATPFARFAAEQRQRQSGWGRQLAYWKTELAGSTPLRFPAGRTPSGLGGTVTSALPPPLTEDVARCAARADVTPFVVCLSAYVALLAALGETSDVVVGTIVAGREPAYEDTIGSFVNTVVVRQPVTGEEPVAALLADVRQRVLAAMDASEVPFVRVVEEVAAERIGTTNPLCRTVFTYGSTPGHQGSTPLGGGRLSAFGISNGTVRFDYELAVEPHGDGFRIRLEYDTGLFDQAEADRVCAAYCEVLRRVATGADAAVRDCISDLGPVLSKGSAPSTAAPDRVEAVVSQAPDDVREEVRALVADGLGVGDLDEDDDFFVRGGHSMLAAELVGRLRTRFGVELALVEFFEQPTSRGLAGLIFRRRLTDLEELVDALSDTEVAAQLAALGSALP